MKRLKWPFGKKPQIYRLHDIIDKGTFKEAWMTPDDFDKHTRDVIVIEVDGHRISFLATPVCAFVIHRGKPK